MEFVRLSTKTRCETSSSSSSEYDLEMKIREVEKWIYQLDKIASLCEKGSFSFGNLPRQDQMTIDICNLLREIQSNRFFMFHSYYFSILRENIERKPFSDPSFYIRELCEIEAYVRKVIQFYEWCGRQN